MNCYNHHSVSAVAICKNCSKGLCPDCLTEVENGIACTATCVDDVKLLNNLINKNKNATGRAAGAYYRTTFTYLALSLLFFYSGFLYPVMKFYMLPAGLIFFLVSISAFISARKYKKA
jgi:hypothetical protein